jgi:uncharacterized membrane protein
MKQGLGFALLRGLFVSLALLPLVPAAVAHLAPLEALGRLLDACFAFQCERDPLRTFQGFAVCARCYGIYAGLALGALLLRPRITPFAQRVWLAVAALVLVLDVSSEVLGMRPAWAPLRLVTGALLGYPVSLGLLLRLAPNHRAESAVAGRRRGAPALRGPS